MRWQVFGGLKHLGIVKQQQQRGLCSYGGESRTLLQKKPDSGEEGGDLRALIGW